MIPLIRSHSELMAITESRDNHMAVSKNNEIDSLTEHSGQRKRYLRSLDKKEISLPKLPETIRCKWKKNKDSVSRFIDRLGYNSQIQSSYDLTLLERQNNNNQEDVA